MSRPLARVGVLFVLTACGGEVRQVDDYVDHDMGVVTSELNVGQSGGCDTSIVGPLTQQLIAELNCISPNTTVVFDHLIQ